MMNSITLPEVAAYLDAAIATFDSDPPDTEFQRGYLEALRSARRELFPTAKETVQ